MSAGPDMSLAVALVFCYFSAKFAIHLDMTFCVFIGIFAVFQISPSLTSRVEFADLYLPLNRRKRSFSIERYSIAGKLMIHCPALTFTPLYGCKEVGESSSEAKLIGTLNSSKSRLCYNMIIYDSTNNRSDSYSSIRV